MIPPESCPLTPQRNCIMLLYIFFFFQKRHLSLKLPIPGLVSNQMAEVFCQGLNIWICVLSYSGVIDSSVTERSMGWTLWNFPTPWAKNGSPTPPGVSSGSWCCGQLFYSREFPFVLASDAKTQNSWSSKIQTHFPWIDFCYPGPRVDHNPSHNVQPSFQVVSVSLQVPHMPSFALFLEASGFMLSKPFVCSLQV